MKTNLKIIILSISIILITSKIFCQQGVSIINSPPNTDTISNQDVKSVFVEISATFMGGDIVTFRNWVQKNLIYPREAVKNDIFGKVLVQFTIDETGRLCNTEIYKGVHPLLDNEVLRVVQLSPLWEPASLAGKNVRQTFIIPVIFTLGRKFIREHSK